MALETFTCNNRFKQQNHPNSAAQPEFWFSQRKNGKRERPAWALPSQSLGRRTDRRRRTSRSSSSRTPHCRTWGTCGCSSSTGTAKPNNNGHLCSFCLARGPRNRGNEHFNMLKSRTAWRLNYILKLTSPLQGHFFSPILGPFSGSFH